MARGVRTVLAVVACAALFAGAEYQEERVSAPKVRRAEAPKKPHERVSFGAAGDAARLALEHLFYVSGPSKWNECVPDLGCRPQTSDWGADSLTSALYFRWSLSHDMSIVPMLDGLDRSGPSYRTCRLPYCRSYSDTPMWDSIAASREYAATREPHALHRAKAAFDFIDDSDAFALGACPTVAYQQPNGGHSKLKTLETDSNYIKAALLLAEATSDSTYLPKATARYAAVRRYYLDPDAPLYTAYVFDSGTACEALPRRFFASVNGNMILDGLMLAEATGDPSYREQGIATAKALDESLSDASGVYENLLADNDVVEPLVEAFYRLATTESQPFARAWIVRNAGAVASEGSPDGAYGRLWGGPPASGSVTAQQANGGFALVFAAAALAPEEKPAGPDVWAASTFVPEEVTALPATLEFTGRAVALVGSIGEHCCENGHARVFVDDIETFDGTGIWQNKSSSGRTLPGSVLFAWRWPSSGHHTLRLEPGVENPKEGAPFLHVEGYELAP
jgi:hypothetical protein